MWLSSVVPTFRRFSRRDDTFHQREIRLFSSPLFPPRLVNGSVSEHPETLT